MRGFPGHAAPMFDCEFKCFCGSVIGLKVALAMVKSDAGIQVMCKHCSQFYAVKEDGAHALDKPNGGGIDAEGRLVEMFRNLTSREVLETMAGEIDWTGHGEEEVNPKEGKPPKQPKTEKPPKKPSK